MSDRTVKHNILLCGLPESGKTTFLAALWYLVVHQEIKTALKGGRLPDSREYLNQIANKWCRFIQLDHTPTDELQDVSIILENGHEEICLHLPDMSGEAWDMIWSTRSYPDHIEEWIRIASGVMIFIHADKIRPPIDIMTHNAMLEAVGEQPIEGEISDWSPEKTATQVQIVDLLQALSIPPIGKPGGNLAVILSAWDKVEEIGIRPQEYVAANLPLLSQFLSSSDGFSKTKIFGVSAQGGDLGSEGDIQRIKSENVPSKRIRVVDGDCVCSDLTVAIKWLISI